MRNLANDLQVQANMLAKIDKTRPKQINLRRAASAAYYAMFHELCQLIADEFVGKNSSTERAWLQAYRALNHGEARNRCKLIVDAKRKQRNSTNDVRDKDMNFPSEVVAFADKFTSLQKTRHEADYDPQLPPYRREDIIGFVEMADKVRRDLRRVAPKHRKAFAVFLLLPRRTATD